MEKKRGMPLIVYLPSTQKDKFKLFCEAEGLTMSTVTRMLVKRLLSEKIVL